MNRLTSQGMISSVFKNVIAPVQAWLLSQGRCVGCGSPLSEFKHVNHPKGEKVACAKCGRIFIKDKSSNKYRRALLDEV